MEKSRNGTQKCVAAIIVTYNRLNLLKRCVSGLRNQSYKDFDIIVVNNGSSDGTEEWLRKQTDIIAISQSNSGGAGGFYSGMKKAYDDGYEWIWLMDDDGLAENNQLRNLLNGALSLNSLFVNALVCNIESTECLSFGLIYSRRLTYLVKDVVNVSSIPDSINPFNGTLINRKVVSKVGLIKKEMFIWGDEKEYTFRAQRAGFGVYTITNAIHYHPRSKGDKKNIIPFYKKYQFVVPSIERQKIKFRNDGFIYTKYSTFGGRAKYLIKYSLYFILRFDYIGLFRLFKYYHMGAKNHFT